MTARVIAFVAVLTAPVALAAATAWFLLRGRGRHQAAEGANPADMGRELRLLALTTPAEECIQPLRAALRQRQLYRSASSSAAAASVFSSRYFTITGV
jgi:hypothetical protein